MKIPLIIAHGQEIIAFIFYVGTGAIVMSVIGLVAALRKKKEAVSRLGVSSAVVGFIVGALLAWWHGFSEFIGWLSVVMLAPLPIAAVALILSLKRREKNA